MLDEEIDKLLTAKETGPIVMSLPGDRQDFDGGSLTSCLIKPLQGQRIWLDRHHRILVAVNDETGNCLLCQAGRFGDRVYLAQLSLQFGGGQIVSGRGGWNARISG